MTKVTLAQIEKKALKYNATALSKLQRMIWTARWDFEMGHNDIAKLLDRTDSHIRVQLGRISSKMDQDPSILKLAEA